MIQHISQSNLHLSQNVSVHCTGMVYYFISCKNYTKYRSVILLQQVHHCNTVSRFLNIYSHFVIIVAVTVISFI